MSYQTPFPILLLFYAWFLLLAFSCALFLPPVAVLGFTSNSCFSCHDLFWPSFGLDLGIRLLRVTHPLSWFPPLTSLWAYVLLLSAQPSGASGTCSQAQPCLDSYLPWSWPWCSLSSQFSMPATFLFQTPADPTSQCVGGEGLTLKVLVISLEEAGKLANSGSHK